jgi:hypothetical protein
MVASNPNLEPDEDLGNMRDLIDEWRRNMQAQSARQPSRSAKTTIPGHDFSHPTNS